MPISQLEYTDNIIISDSMIQVFFKKLHIILKDTIDCNINSCKARAYKLSDYTIGLDNDKS